MIRLASHLKLFPIVQLISQVQPTPSSNPMACKAEQYQAIPKAYSSGFPGTCVRNPYSNYRNDNLEQGPAIAMISVAKDS